MTHSATISKRFHFSASHALGGLPPEHQCSRLHGHNYDVEVRINGITDDVGFVVDYSLLAPFGAYLDATFDHRHLNDALSFNPTAENLGAHLATILLSILPKDALPRLNWVEVGISETPRSNAWVRITVAQS